MITALSNKSVQSATDNSMEYRGLSTDTKPTDAPNGSVFLEMNTGKVFCYDAEGENWIELGGSASANADAPEIDPGITLDQPGLEGNPDA